MFLKLCFCFGFTIVAAAGVTGIVDWWRRRPLVEEKSVPLYITREV